MNVADTKLEAMQPPPEASPLIEIGLVLVGRLDEIDREAVEVVRRRAEQALREWFPEFTWQLIPVERGEMTALPREEPAAFFSQAQAERDLHKWDFVVVITNADLIGHYEPFALAVVSRTLDLAVLSTARVDPLAVDPSADQESRIQRVGQRIGVLLLRCLGHLNGLEPTDDADNLMWEADDVADLDRKEQLTTDQIERMRNNLLSIADLRLEEQHPAGRRSEIRFLLQAAWQQRREILEGVLQAEPWQFPVRLSRLTTAAFSAMLILLMTAETWDMSMSQSPTSASVLILIALLLTTGYVVKRQQLLVRRQDRLMTEQIAVSNMTSTLIVLCGLVTTLLALFGTSAVLGLLLFPRDVVSGWAASVDVPVAMSHYLLLSGVVSALSLSIGALGVAFEDQMYFRHVTFVDEEY